MALKFIGSEAPGRGYTLQMETLRSIALVQFNILRNKCETVKVITFDELCNCSSEDELRKLIGVQQKEKIYIRNNLKRYIKFL